VQTWDLRSIDVEAYKPQVLDTDEEGRTIALTLPAGEQLQEHQVHERAWLVVIDGEVEVSAGESSERGGPGHLYLFAPREQHEVTAASDARLLLVLAPWPGEGHPSKRD
jgi:quercetin dioxygenase-like cupin family protein